MTLGRLHPAGTWTVFAAAVIAVLAHVCALPFEAGAEVGAIPAHEPHHDSPGEAIHAASCDGTVARTPDLAGPLPAAVARALDATYVPAAGIAGDASTAAPARCRPLFLLHAALLI